VRKHAVVYERVVVRRRERPEVARVSARASKEELRVELEGHDATGVAALR
jgi:stress response protein YsnF